MMTVRKSIAEETLEPEPLTLSCRLVEHYKAHKGLRTAGELIELCRIDKAF